MYSDGFVQLVLIKQSNWVSRTLSYKMSEPIHSPTKRPAGAQIIKVNIFLFKLYSLLLKLLFDSFKTIAQELKF